jgi:hypothetical protein
MAKVRVVMNLPVGAETVWRSLRDFAGIIKWQPDLANLQVTGSGVGAIRTLTDKDGARQVERLESLNDEARTLSFTVLQTTLPLEGCVAQLSVRDLGFGKSEVAWSSTFGAKGAPEAEVVSLLEKSYRRALARLARLLSS